MNSKGTPPNTYIYPVSPQTPLPSRPVPFLFITKPDFSEAQPASARSAPLQPFLPDFAYVSARSDLTVTSDCQGGLKSQHFSPSIFAASQGKTVGKCKPPMELYPLVHPPFPATSFLLWLLSWGLSQTPLAAPAVCLTQACQ